MNTNQNTQNNTTEHGFPFIPEEIQSPGIPSLSCTTKDIITIHNAKIITPQPYGVFALCKIIEHLQNN
ncbi:MAG TPA: hypothetical protein VK808_08100 [Bacteroidia bacterium]|nr:hypothetical protein [Bacteroidia bacterium]